MNGYKRIGKLIKSVSDNSKRYAFKLPINALLSALIFLLCINIIASIAARYAMNQSLDQQRIAEHVLFEINYAHNVIIKESDVALRGFAIIHDERYLYRSNAFLKIVLEDNYKRLDSLLTIQGFKDLESIEPLHDYKLAMRTFINWHGELIELIRSKKMDQFHSEFTKDPGSKLWPVYSKAIAFVSGIESKLTMRAARQYRFFSDGVVYTQFITLFLSIPLILMVLNRLNDERINAEILEQRKLTDERNKIKEQFLSVMSHEIRTPLNSIIGLMHVLKNRSPREDQKEIIETLKNSSDHLLHLVDDVLDYNRIQANSLSLEAIPFYLDELLRQTHTMFQHLANEKNILFAMQMEPSIPLKLIGDPIRLVQILNNLIANALKFTAKGSVRLQITPVAQKADFVTLEFLVTDTGIGIANEKLSFIFQPFAQAENHIHRMYGGTGLGLVIVKNLTELMGGKVEIESTVGHGSSFKVTIPFQLPPMAVENNLVIREQPDNKIPLENCTVLYVEDVPSNQFLMNSLLSDWGALYENANDGKEALALIYKNTFDIIILDIQLPDIDGYELAKHIRNNHFSFNQFTPILLFSAFSDISQDQIKGCGANDFIGKPFTPEKLLLKIKTLVNRI